MKIKTQNRNIHKLNSYMERLEERRIFRNQMKAELKVLASESLSESVEELKRRGVLFDAVATPSLEGTSRGKSKLDYEREIEILKRTVEELVRVRGSGDDDSPRQKYARWENKSNLINNLNSSSDKPIENEDYTMAPHSPLRARSPASSVVQSVKEMNGMFVCGPTVNIGSHSGSQSNEDKVIDESVNFISEDIRNLFSSPNNLDESDYTLLRVFNPVKYPQPKKKVPMAKMEEMQINKLKLELSIHKHRHRIENNNKGRVVSKREQLPAEISPRKNFRRGNQSYHDNDSSHHGFDEPTTLSRSQRSNQVELLDPVLDHFAPSAPTSPRQKNMNRVVLVKPSPYGNVYEEAVFVVESLPPSCKADDATQSQEQRPQTRMGDLTLDEFQQITEKMKEDIKKLVKESDTMQHQLQLQAQSGSPRMADITLDEFHKITDIMKDDIKNLVRDTVKKELVSEHGNSGKHHHAAAYDPSIHLQQQWAKKIESMIAEKVEDLRNELFALRFTESTDSSSVLPKDDNRHSKTFPSEHHHHPPNRDHNGRKTSVRYGNHTTTSHAVAHPPSGSTRTARPSIIHPHPPSQSIPSRAIPQQKPVEVQPQPIIPDEPGSGYASAYSDSLDQNSSSLVLEAEKPRRASVMPPPPSQVNNLNAKAQRAVESAPANRRASHSVGSSSFGTKQTTNTHPIKRITMVGNPTRSVSPKSQRNTIIGNSKPLPVATVMPGGIKAAVARTIEKIEENDYPDIGDHAFISPVVAPEAVYSKGNDEVDPEVSVTLLTDSFDDFDPVVPIIHSEAPVAEKPFDEDLAQMQPIDKPHSRKPSVRHTQLTPPSSSIPDEEPLGKKIDTDSILTPPSSIPDEEPLGKKIDTDSMLTPPSSSIPDEEPVGKKVDSDSIVEHKTSDGRRRRKKKKDPAHLTAEGPTSLAAVNSIADDNVSGDNNSKEETDASDTLAPLTPTISPRRTFTANLALRDKQRESVESLEDLTDEHKADASLNDESVHSVRSHGGRVSRSRTPTSIRQSTGGDQSRLGSTGGMSRSSSKDESLRADSHYRSLMSTLLSLVDLKANVKKELKDWAVQFEQEHNHPPGNDDKAAISDRFLAYKMLSQQMADLKEEIKAYEKLKGGNN